MVKTIKKSLAVVLALAVCLSLFCIPASAASTDTLPYLLCTYEDGVTNIAQGANDIGTFVEGGVGGIGHALQLPAVSGTDYYLRSKVADPKYVNGTFPVGSKFVVSFWAKAVELTGGSTNLDFHLYNDNLGTRLGTYIVRNPEIGKWYKFKIEFVPTAELTTGYMRFRTMFNGTYCLDDFEITFIENTSDFPESSDFVATGNIAEGNQVTFSHTFTPATSSAAGVTDASLVRLVNISSTDEKTVMGVCGINETMTIPAIPANSAGMGFEVVPMSSDGKVGEATTFGLPEATIYAPTLPYILCTYEDDAINFASGANPTGTIVEGGVGGSGHALQLTTGAGAYTEFYIKDKDGQYATGAISAGVNYTVSFWAKPVTEIANMDFHLYDGGSFGNYVTTKTKTEPTADGWRKYTLVCTRETDTTITYWRFRQNFVGTYLIDDFEVSIVKPSDAPASSNFAVTGDVVAGKIVTFAHTFTPATSSAQNVKDKSLVRLVNVTATGERAVIGICGIKEAMKIPAIPANSASLEFEVVPMSSDSKVGNTVAYAVSIPEVIEGITIERVEGNEVKVSTDTKLEEEQLIFVTYDANNKMVDYEILFVDLDANTSDSFSPVDLTAGSYTKVMLWDVDCLPLADMIRY